MRFWPLAFIVSVVGSPVSADVAEELATMLEKHPDADWDGDGVLTEDEAGRYMMRRIQKKRPNRGPGIGDRSLITEYEARTHGSMPYRLLKPLAVETDQQYPLILSLHGSGGVGDDNVSNLRFWNGVMAGLEWRKAYPAFVVVPQRRPGGIWGPKPDDDRVRDVYVRNDLDPALELVDDICREFPVDVSRIYVLGSSGGGVGTWNALSARPELFAAAIPVCGRFSADDSELGSLTDVPVWCFHGDADQLVDVEYSRRAFAELTAAGGNMKYTELRGVRHNSWIQAFQYRGDDQSKGYVTRVSDDRCDPASDVWKWLFRQAKN